MEELFQKNPLVSKQDIEEIAPAPSTSPVSLSEQEIFEQHDCIGEIKPDGTEVLCPTCEKWYETHVEDPAIADWDGRIR